MVPSNELLPYLSILSIIISIGLLAGSFSYAFRNGRQTQLAKLQKENNDALQQRVTTLEGRAEDLEKENIIQRHLIELITDALKKRGLIITIDGEMITIEDRKTGVRTNHVKRTTTTSHVVKKEET